jgi:hypothetical protein
MAINNADRAAKLQPMAFYAVPGQADLSRLPVPAMQAVVMNKAATTEAVFIKSINVKSTDGLSLDINHNISSSRKGIFASPLYFMVSGPKLKGSETVRVAIKNYYDAPPNMAGKVESAQEVGLVYDATAFRAKAQDIPLSINYTYYNESFHQIVSVIVDGVTLIDNARINMTW